MYGTKVTILLIFIAVYIFSPFLSYAYTPQTVDITVSATISGSSTPPVEFCGDNICNSGETCSSCSYDCGSCVGGGGGGGGTVVIPEDNRAIFKGRAYPLAVLTILKNSSVIAVFKAEKTGLFEREINGLSSGTYNFAIFAEDSDGRKSVTIGFSAGILSGKTTTISGIFISPTIDLGPRQVEKGNPVDIVGQAFPESSISIFIASNEIVKETNSTLQGKWSYKLDTNILSEEEHSVRAKATVDEGEQSSFSQTISFLVVKKGALVCKGADLNFDNKINLTDFSILLYYWGQKKPQNICADINQDGKADLIDFSIMMYYWTK